MHPQCLNCCYTMFIWLFPGRCAGEGAVPAGSWLGQEECLPGGGWPHAACMSHAHNTLQASGGQAQESERWVLNSVPLLGWQFSQCHFCSVWLSVLDWWMADFEWRRICWNCCLMIIYCKQIMKFKALYCYPTWWISDF